MAKGRTDNRTRWHTRRKKTTNPNKITMNSSLLSRIASMKLKDMPSLIKALTDEKSVPHQYSIIEACLRRILNEMSPGSDRSPHSEQIRTVRRLVYGKGDTLLIARTGFGKSLILHSFSILTEKITLQIIPLNKLGDQQLKDISNLGDTRPCVLNAESKW